MNPYDICFHPPISVVFLDLEALEEQFHFGNLNLPCFSKQIKKTWELKSWKATNLETQRHTKHQSSKSQIMTFWGRLSKLLSVFPKRSAKKPPSLQVPVVQKVDSTIHWINHYPLDNAIGWRYPTFEQPVPDFDWRRRKTQNPKTFFDSDKPFPNKIWRSTPEHLFTCKIVRMPSPIVHTQYFIFIFFFCMYAV